jgi:hypothetical protein
VRGAVSTPAETIALIEDITADEVRAVFERMLRHSPALSITGKGANAKSARELAGLLAGATTA